MFCSNCGTQNDDDAINCSKCMMDLKNPNQMLEKRESSALNSVVPMNRTGLSILAGYLGLFCIIPLFAPIALIVSILALKQLKKHPEKLGKGRAVFGLVMGILGTAVLLAFIILTRIKTGTT